MKKEECKIRNFELDSIKFLAIFLVYTTHFIADFNPDIFSLWTTYPTKIVLGGGVGEIGCSLFWGFIRIFCIYM